MAAPGTITIKVVLDTDEAEVKLASLRNSAAGLLDMFRYSRGGVIPPQPVSKYIADIAGKLDGCRISPQDSDYLISCIKARTY
jgi:hypothetical protein